MNKLWLLFKIQVFGFFSINRILHTKDPKEKRRAIAFAAMMTLIGLLFFGYSTMTAVGCYYMGLTKYLPLFLLVLSAILTLVLTFMKSSSMLFGYRDYDMVMSMPVSSFTIIVSRLLVMYLLGFASAILIMLPGSILYGVVMKPGIGIWMMLILAIWIAPMIPIVAASLLGALITAVSVRFRYKNLVTVVLSMAMILALLLGSFGFQGKTAADITGFGKETAQLMGTIYPVGVWYQKAVSQADWLSYLEFLLLSIGVVVVFAYLLARFYKRLNTAMAAQHSKRHYVIQTLQVSTPFWALVRKEVKRYFSCPIYFMNTSVGMLLLLVMAAATLFLDAQQWNSLLETPGAYEMVQRMAPWLISFCVTLTPTTACSLSLEGRSQWLMCAAPVPAKVVYQSKIAFALVVLLPVTMISSALMLIGMRIPISQAVVLFAVPIAFALFASVVGLFCNLKFPKFDWSTEMQVVKQSASVAVTMGLGVGALLILGGISWLSGAYQTGTSLIGVLVLLLLTWFLYQWICRQPLYLRE